ncbi:MAG: hypothetical protein F6K17_19095 [Okeania sp. SIO3C4]|nr:hypothetical protein [Okeania sp. SIO3C4]
MIYLSPKKTIIFLIFIVIGLTIASITGQFFQYYGFSDSVELIEKFNVDGEYTIPSLFSSFTLFFCCIILGIISHKKWQQKDKYLWKWIGLSVIFFYLGLDETISLHEQLM